MITAIVLWSVLVVLLLVMIYIGGPLWYRDKARFPKKQEAFRVGEEQIPAYILDRFNIATDQLAEHDFEYLADFQMEGLYAGVEVIMRVLAPDVSAGNTAAVLVGQVIQPDRKKKAYEFHIQIISELEDGRSVQTTNRRVSGTNIPAADEVILPNVRDAGELWRWHQKAVARAGSPVAERPWDGHREFDEYRIRQTRELYDEMVEAGLLEELDDGSGYQFTKKGVLRAVWPTLWPISWLARWRSRWAAARWRRQLKNAA